MAKPEKEPTVTFRSEFDPDYRVVPVNSAFGGSTPSGEIFVDLGLDTFPTPNVLVHSFTATDGGKQLGAEVRREPSERNVINRQFKVGLLMTPRVALELATFLQEKVANQKASEREREK